jgi:hypothetical protein
VHIHFNFSIFFFIYSKALHGYYSVLKMQHILF